MNLLTITNEVLKIKNVSIKCVRILDIVPGVNQFGGESVTYEGVGGTKKWERLESYGPKFCENITQAIARDLSLIHI